MSLNDKKREKLIMPEIERQGLLDAGWKLEVVTALHARGFREVMPDVNADGTQTPRFLRQTQLPHLLIRLEKGDTLEDLDSAIFEAGRRDGHESLASGFMSFFDRVKNWKSQTSLESRLAKLEVQLDSQH